LTPVDGLTQRKIVLALTVGLAGVAWGVTAVVGHEGRFILARAIALAVISFWIALQIYREARRGGRRRQHSPRW
jgi:hypothetical protein